MDSYEAPTVTELGSLDDLTLSTIYKNGGSGDVVIINGVTEPVAGSTVISTS